MAYRASIFIFLLCYSGINASPSTKYRPEIFFDNGVLPENLEVRVYIFKEEIKRIFILIEKEQRPLFLTVTPCSVPIEWRLILRHSPGETSYPETDIMNNNVPIGLPSTYYGQERQMYANYQAPSGLYMLELNSKGRDTSVLVYLTTKDNLTDLYPKLPSEPNLEVLKVRKSRILISWTPSPSETEGKQIEYCVAINPRHNYPTECGIKVDTVGDIPPTLPPSIGFGFWWERNAKKHLMTKIKDIRKSAEVKTDITYTCIGRKTWHMAQNLQEGKTYYFDVFALYPHTNRSISYIGTSATTKGANVVNGKLKENTLITLSLNESVGYNLTFEYSASNPLYVMWIFVQSCSGPGPVHLTLSTDGGLQQVFSVDIIDIHTIVVHEPPNGTLQFTFSSGIKWPRTVRLWISRKYHKYPFPTMPSDRRVQLFDTLTTCESVTLAWKTTTDEKVRYCLYKQSVKNQLFKYFNKPENTCEEPVDSEAIKGRQKILCRRYHRFSRHRFNNVILQEVKDLHPATTYVFEVQVTKFRGKTLSYEQVWATTRNDCNGNYR